MLKAIGFTMLLLGSAGVPRHRAPWRPRRSIPPRVLVRWSCFWARFWCFARAGKISINRSFGQRVLSVTPRAWRFAKCLPAAPP